MSSVRNAFWVFFISVRWELAQLLISCGVFITFWAFVCLLLSIPHAARVHNPRCSRWRSKTLPASLYIDSFTLATSGGEGTGAFWCCWHPCKVTGHEGHFLHSLHCWWGEASLHCPYWTCFFFFFPTVKAQLPSITIIHRKWRSGPQDMRVAGAESKAGQPLNTRHVSLSAVKKRQTQEIM